MTFPNIRVEKIQDEVAQDNFLRIRDYFRDSVFEKGNFRFFTVTYPTAVTARAYLHKLPFQPKDVIMLSNTNGATVTWHYDDFDATSVYLTTSAATTIRAFIGRYEETR